MIAPGPLKFVEISSELETWFPLWGDLIHFISLDGVGIPTTKRMIQRSPTQHGATDRGFRIDARRMTMNLLIDGNDTSHSDYLRDLLVDKFSPVNGQLTLRCTREDNTIKLIDCFVDGQMDFPSSRRVGSMQPVTIPLIAPNPAWYGEQIFENSATPDENGDITVVLNVSSMTYHDYPVIDVTGPINSLSSIGFLPGTGGHLAIVLTEAIPSNETWRITTDPFNRSIVRLSDSENMMPKFTGDSMRHIIDWRIPSIKEALLLHTSSSDAIDGFFPIGIYKSSGVAAESGSSMTVYWQNRYLSL